VSRNSRSSSRFCTPLFQNQYKNSTNKARRQGKQDKRKNAKTQYFSGFAKAEHIHKTREKWYNISVNEQTEFLIRFLPYPAHAKRRGRF
jgi:hypothetical protein